MVGPDAVATTVELGRLTKSTVGAKGPTNWFCAGGQAFSILLEVFCLSRESVVRYESVYVLSYRVL